MKRREFFALILLVCILLFLGLGVAENVQASGLYQIPTIDIPTVTGTVEGPYVLVRIDIDQDFINVRSGPHPNYEKIGVLQLGVKAPALGISAGQDWILIGYPGVPGGKGWVFAPYVSIKPGSSLPIVESPGEPTPQFTATIDPTLAAQFLVTALPTQLPTFTPPDPLIIPTFTDNSLAQMPGGIPAGLVIIILAGIGLFMGLFALVQNR
jgi:hypothetical protein